MYQVNQKVKVKNPMSLKEEIGEIWSVLKILDSKDAGYVDNICYLIDFFNNEKPRIIMDFEIIGIVEQNTIKTEKEEKYVRLDDVEHLLNLLKERDCYHDWSNIYKEIDDEIKELLKSIRESAIGEL